MPYSPWIFGWFTYLLFFSPSAAEDFPRRMSEVLDLKEVCRSVVVIAAGQQVPVLCSSMQPCLLCITAVTLAGLLPLAEETLQSARDCSILHQLKMGDYCTSFNSTHYKFLRCSPRLIRYLVRDT